MLRVSLQRSARAAAEECDAVFTELIRSIELKRFEVRELITAQEKAAVSQAEQLLDKIQKEITELKKNEAELDRLSHTEDHIRFLQVRDDPQHCVVPTLIHAVNIVCVGLCDCDCRVLSLSVFHRCCRRCPRSPWILTSPLAP